MLHLEIGARLHRTDAGNDSRLIVGQIQQRLRRRHQSAQPSAADVVRDRIRPDRQHVAGHEDVGRRGRRRRCRRRCAPARAGRTRSARGRASSCRRCMRSSSASATFGRALYVRCCHSTKMSLARYCFVFSCAMICAPARPSNLVRPGVLRMPVGVEQIPDRLACRPTSATVFDSSAACSRRPPFTIADAVVSGHDDDVAAGAGYEREGVAQSCGRERGVMALGARRDRSRRRPEATDRRRLRSAYEARPGDLAREPWAESNVKRCPPKGSSASSFACETSPNHEAECTHSGHHERRGFRHLHHGRIRRLRSADRWVAGLPVAPHHHRCLNHWVAA